MCGSLRKPKRRKSMSKRVKKSMREGVVVPAIMYGLETWILMEQSEGGSKR